jgi:thiol-disulfide isomerase/thioredoxin
MSAYTGRVQQLFGVLMLLTAIAIYTNFDKTIQLKLLDVFPSYSSALTSFEKNSTVKEQLDILKGKKSSSGAGAVDASGLFNENKPAPEFIGITKWLNTNQPLTLKELKGKVVLVDFWTYTCINCIRTLPHVTSWYDKYKNKGFVVIGVHTPEFEFEKETKNVENAIKQYNIHYPVPQDNAFATWNNYNNQYWPAEYLIDAKGIIRRTHFGEGKYDETEQAIQVLLRESGQQVSSSLENMPDQTPTTQNSPETYLGSKRMQYYYPSGQVSNGQQNFTLSDNPPLNSFSYGGQWNITDETAVAGKNSVITYHFSANKVFLILRPGINPSNTATVKVLLDGKAIDAKVAGADVHNGTITIDTDRLYDIADLKGNVGDHILKLEFQTSGVEVYTFTFG